MKDKEQFEKEKEDLKEALSKEGDELRKNMLDKLFNLNCILSAAFLVLYQFDNNSSQLKMLNILPFCTIILILFYNLHQLKMLGFAYHKIDTWEKDVDMKLLENHNRNAFNIAMISIILTIIELVYLFYKLLNTNVA